MANENHKNGIDLHKQVFSARKSREYVATNAAVWEKNIDDNVKQAERRQQHEPNQCSSNLSKKGKRLPNPKSVYTDKILCGCKESAPATVSSDLLSHLQISHPDELLKECKSLRPSAQDVA